jgi:hypothetical protein
MPSGSSNTAMSGSPAWSCSARVSATSSGVSGAAVAVAIAQARIWLAATGAERRSSPSTGRVTRCMASASCVSVSAPATASVQLASPPSRCSWRCLEGAGSGVAVLGAGACGADPCGFVVQLPAVADRPDQPAHGIRAPASRQHIQLIRDALRREPHDQVIGDTGGDASGAQPPGQRRRASLRVVVGGCMLFFFNSMSMHTESVGFSVSGGTVSGKCGHGRVGPVDRLVARRRVRARLFGGWGVGEPLDTRRGAQHVPEGVPPARRVVAGRSWRPCRVLAPPLDLLAQFDDREQPAGREE